MVAAFFVIVACKRPQTDAVDASPATSVAVPSSSGPSWNPDVPDGALGMLMGVEDDGGLPNEVGIPDASAGNYGQHRMTAKTMTTPEIRMGALTVNGRLSNDVIQRVIKMNLSRFRFCYEQGLARRPSLAGSVSTKLVIARDGSVISAAQDSATSMADVAVTRCVVHGFECLSFPAIEGGGLVTVVAPLAFSNPL